MRGKKKKKKEEAEAEAEAESEGGVVKDEDETFRGEKAAKPNSLG